MAIEDIKKKKKKSHRDHGDTRASKSFKETGDDDRATTKSSAAADRPLDVETLRKARLEYLAKPPGEKRKEMKYEYVKSTKTVSQTAADRERQYRLMRERSPDSQHTKPSRKPAKRTNDTQKRMRRDDGESEYVYGRPDNVRRDTPTRPATKSPSKTSVRDHASSTARRHIPERRNTEPITRRTSNDDRDAERGDSGRATSRQQRDSRSPSTMVQRSTASADKSQRPPLKRNATTTTTLKSKIGVGASNLTHVSDGQRNAAGLFSGMFLPHNEPPKKVSCLTCGADDVPIVKSAKLPCSHRMCHSCLKRIFTMSVKDPAHMPPRCCTDQHIDLKHVDKLFDQKFKVLWNRKYDEFKTKNRIYCPARKCGAWIKPHYMKIENGRKVGKCKQCKTRVCGICSQKMHVSRDCPKDPETKAFVQVAKEKGWQRCYNCSAMVELKEGCNHMTCRCTAEFCMICGLKWKSCDCPWFNYQAVDAHLGDPVRYQEEMDRRRDQVERDEALARRMQQLGLGNDAERDDAFGNAAIHHMNGNFIQQAREALTANYAQAGQAARDLINGLVMGRENRTPGGIPLPMEQMLELLGQRGARDPAEEDHGGDSPRRAGRRGTARRRHAAQEAGGEHATNTETDEERRIRAWANSAPA
ncbi:hypothetical protein PV08_10653 [Exophiala spinifera]|uniref:RBR-type E3 ubiquitin transferase n=1 Tax=Exophiala spinifera TaxID=91928 RepID=A0A0D2AX98_9EURO|nr:uncharacterized protein PV08_10653 [Exophiala spinifera]KIW11353.1 hypothetical protein PV08_10653 [Exophiala spinifera]